MPKRRCSIPEKGRNPFLQQIKKRGIIPLFDLPGYDVANRSILNATQLAVGFIIPQRLMIGEKKPADKEEQNQKTGYRMQP